MDIKEFLKRIIDFGIKQKMVWKLLDSTLLSFARYAELTRKRDKSLISKKIIQYFPDFIVRHGPFKGMKYPSSASTGVPFAKLIGSYERELQPLIKQLCQVNYTEVIDIGCAEGYYAVGFAMRLKSAKIYAFDIDERAIRSCKKMAEANQVADRIVYGNVCDEETLMKIPITQKTLIFCDCEGCEKDLFSKKVAGYFRNSDLLIEIHDFKDLYISSTIRSNFENTHDIKVIESIDDIKKAKVYAYKEICDENLEMRKMLLGEYRPNIMEWFFITPKKNEAAL